MKSARPIASMSYYPHEAEYLLPPNWYVPASPPLTSSQLLVKGVYEASDFNLRRDAPAAKVPPRAAPTD
jgi:hypothetical protein